MDVKMRRYNFKYTRTIAYYITRSDNKWSMISTASRMTMTNHS